MTKVMDKATAEQILGLTGTYDKNEFQRVYREMVKKNHPDLGGSTEKMADINAAKEYIESMFVRSESASFTCSPKSSASSSSSSSAYSSSAYYSARSHTSGGGWQAQNQKNAYKSDARTEKERKYARAAAYDPVTQRVRTKYGWVSCEGEPEWKNNVGVPFEYAETDSKFMWDYYNRVAEKEFSRKAHSGRARWHNPFYGTCSTDSADRVTRAESIPWEGCDENSTGWTNAHYAAPDPATAATVDPKSSAAQAAKYAAQAAAAYQTYKSAKQYPGSQTRQQSAYDTANYAYQAATNAYQAAQGAAANYQERKENPSWPKRNDIPGAPAWWSRANWFISHFQWRISVWVLCFIACMTATFWPVDAWTLDASYNALTVIGVANLVGFLNIFGIITNPIRKAWRNRVDARLEAWAAAQGKRVLWDSSQIV